MADTCETCKHVSAHYLDAQLTGYGYCTKHIAYQLKTEADEVEIGGTPIVWKDCSCEFWEAR